MGYLRIAGRGLPDRGPGIYSKLAQIYEKLGDAANAKNSLETAKQIGLAVGPRNLEREHVELLPRGSSQAGRPRRSTRRLRDRHRRTAAVPGRSRTRGARNVPQARRPVRQDRRCAQRAAHDRERPRL